jgi:hypothetical protein
MSRKVFTAGEVLAAADVNSFLMDQSIMSFAGTAARGSAIPSPVEGMVTYNTSNDLLELYNGSAYKIVSATTGGILQVVQGITTTQVSNSTTTHADTGLTATITPKSATSKILVIVNQHCFKGSGNSENAPVVRLFRDATQIQEITTLMRTATTLEMNSYQMMQLLDSPATTSAVTYKTTFRNATAANQVQVQNNSNPSVITLMEVSA